MNIDQLPYILAIADTGSLSAASKKLGISQPAMSKYLANLERHTGVELFTSEKKRLFPTPAGKLYIATARKILTLMQSTHNSIRMLEHQPENAVRLGVSPHRGAVLVGRLFSSFNYHNPQTRLDLYEGYASQLKELLSKGELDLAITSHSGEAPPGLMALPIHHEEVVLAVPAYHRAARELEDAAGALPYADLAEFCDSAFVLPTERSALSDVVMPLFEKAGFQPTVMLTTPNIVMAEAMIRHSGGISFLPVSYAINHDVLRYFRLREPAYMTACVLAQEGHIFTKAERFLICRIAKALWAEPNSLPVEDPALLEFMREFADVEEYL